MLILLKQNSFCKTDLEPSLASLADFSKYGTSPGSRLKVIRADSLELGGWMLNLQLTFLESTASTDSNCPEFSKDFVVRSELRVWRLLFLPEFRRLALGGDDLRLASSLFVWRKCNCQGSSLFPDRIHLPRSRKICYFMRQAMTRRNRSHQSRRIRTLMIYPPTPAVMLNLFLIFWQTR